jgi:peptide chain release factor 2
MLTGLHDSKSAIIEVNPGAGGTEAQDWGEMLLRMYLRWAEKKGFSAEILNYQAGETAGLKNATVFIQGENAYGFLRSEKGVHRLVRISPFDSNARRHTSFASVSVMPEIDDDIKVEIRDEDLRIDTYRSSGAGGQHVNKTDSAVRLTHLPTGLVVACQNERSQHKNKATAMKLLKAKIYEVELEKKEAELAKIAGERKKIDFGSQIRSYVMQPYQLVKDLRTDVETGNVFAVMDGDIDQFIEGYLMSEDFNQPTV